MNYYRRLCFKTFWIVWPLAWLGEAACCIILITLDWLMEHIFGAYMDWCEEKNSKPTNIHHEPTTDLP